MNSPESEPYFSILIPTYSRPQALRRCLASLTELTRSDISFEVVVVDDGSPSPPVSVIDEFSGELNLTFLQVPHAGPAAARNAGGRIASGRYFFFTDDDCRIPPDFLISARERATPGSGRFIAGRTRIGESPGIFATASEDIVNYFHEVFNERREQARFLTTSNLIVEREAFLASGGFSESFPLAGGEDREFCDRLVHEGHRIQYAPELEVQHEHRMSFKGFCRQQFHYGRGAHLCRRLSSRRRSEPLRLEPVRFYLDLVMFPLNEKWNAERMLRSLLITLAQFLVLLGFLHDWYRSGKGDFN